MDIGQINNISSIVSHNQRLKRLMIDAKSIMQVNITEKLSREECLLIVNNNICESAKQKIFNEAKRYINDTPIISECKLADGQNYELIAKFIVSAAITKIMYEYQDKLTINTKDVLETINLLEANSAFCSSQRLNERSVFIINNIYTQLRNTYRNYRVNLLENPETREFSIHLYKNNEFVNMYKFLPQKDNSGNIGSILIYGQLLEGHYKSIKNSMKIFGLPVIDIEVNSGESDYIDIQIGVY